MHLQPSRPHKLFLISEWKKLFKKTLTNSEYCCKLYNLLQVSRNRKPRKSMYNKYRTYQPKWNHNRCMSCPCWPRPTDTDPLSEKWDRMVQWKVTSPPSGNAESKLKKSETRCPLYSGEWWSHCLVSVSTHDRSPLYFYSLSAKKAWSLSNTHNSDSLWLPLMCWTLSDVPFHTTHERTRWTGEQRSAMH